MALPLMDMVLSLHLALRLALAATTAVAADAADAGGSAGSLPPAPPRPAPQASPKLRKLLLPGPRLPTNEGMYMFTNKTVRARAGHTTERQYQRW